MTIDPLWKRAPTVLRAHLGAGLAITGAVVVLTVASASSPLLVSSAGSAAFERMLEPGPNGAAAQGLLAFGEGAATIEGISGVDQLLRDEVTRLPQLDAPTMSMAGMQFQRTPETAGIAGPNGTIPATLVHRDGLLDTVRSEPGSTGDGDGLWLPDTLADDLDAAVGDEVTLIGTSDDDGTAIDVPATIDGIYRDPFDEGLLTPDAPDVWRQVLAGVPRSEESTRVPPLLLADRNTFLDYTVALEDRLLARWESPLAAPDTSLADARELVQGLDALFVRVNDPTSELVATISAFARPGEFRFDTTVPDAVEQATDVAGTLGPSVRSLALAAQAIALLLVAAAVAMLLRQRHRELQLLATQGAAPVETGLRVAFEILPAAVLGAVAGWAASTPIVRLLGPSPQLDPELIRTARGAIVTSVVGALLVAGVVGALAAITTQRRRAEWSGRRLRWLPWEPVALALAAAAGYQLVVRADAERVDPGSVDLLVVAFPLLAVAALVGLAVRAVARVLARLSTVSDRPGRWFAGWLAARRVARLPAHALTLVTAAGMALGLFVYFSALSASTGTALEAKSAALAGAETTSKLFTTWRIEPGLPRSMPDDTTFVWRESATVQPGDIRVDLLAVDPASFGQGASWQPTFAGQPLREVLRSAGTSPANGSSTARVIAVGQTPDGRTLPETGQLVSGGWGGVGFEVATRPEAFPGMRENIPLVVVDARRFFPLIGPYDPTDPETQTNPVRQVFRPEIWLAGPPAAVERYLATRDTRLLDFETRAQVAARPELLAPTWTLGYLTVLGTAIGSLALGALVVYADQRRTERAISYALARRMGMSAASNIAATGAELLALLGVAFGVGSASALAVSWAVASRIDPAPRLPPAPQVEVPLVALGSAAAVIVASSFAAAIWLQVRADRTDVAEVLRVAE